jgi:hypothetical protein
MEEALRRLGPSSQTCVESFGFKLSDVDWKAALTILRRYDPTSTDDLYSPLNRTYGATQLVDAFDIRWIVFVCDDLKSRAARLEANTTDPATTLTFFRRLLGDHSHSTPVNPDLTPIATVEPMERRGNRHRMQIQVESEAAHILVIHMIFGNNVIF